MTAGKSKTKMFVQALTVRVKGSVMLSISTSAGVSYRPVHLVLQILVDPLKSCIATLDPEGAEKNYDI